MSKVILITGASSGIGKACAEYIAAKGHIVYGTSRQKRSLAPSPIRMLQMDVTHSDSIKAAVETILFEQGRIDVVINNAGMGIAGAAELTTIDEIQRQMQTNFMGTVQVCSAVLPSMRRAKSGKIINLSSLGGVMGIPFQGFYSASKFAVEGYSETLSLEVHPFGIQVILVEPGDFSTGFTSSRTCSESTQKDPDYRETFLRCMHIIEKEETGGGNPQKIAALMHRIIRKKHPKFRYKSGNFLQTNFARIKYFIPARTYQYLLRIFYHL